jgi:hypothetical protein
MICRSSTTGMSEHPDATALAQDALGQPTEQNGPFGACKALTAGHEEAQVFGARRACERYGPCRAHNA